MTLLDFLNNKDAPDKISILMLDNHDKVMFPMEYSKKEYKVISKELLAKEVMDISIEEDLVEVWVASGL